MQIQVVPIISTKTDWQLFLSVAKQMLGRNLTKGIDSANMPLEGISSYFAVLGSLKDSETKPDVILSNPGSLLSHGFFGFLFVGDDDLLFNIMEETPFNVLSAPTLERNTRIAIISGTFEEWRTSIINRCSNVSGYGLRLFLDYCLLHFERLGLGKIWSEYKKITLSDKTFYLEEK